MRIAQEGERVLLLSRLGRRLFVNLRRGGQSHTHKGVIEHDAIIGAAFGQPIVTHLDETYYLMRPSIHDQIMSIRRISQIIYPKEIGQILLNLDVRSGRRVIEAGTGSGALTLALAHAVCPGGTVYSYEVRPDMLQAAKSNVESAGLGPWVEFFQQDIADGLQQRDVDAAFLDVREPWRYMSQIECALSDGGHFGALVPTTNQIVSLLDELAQRPFVAVQVLELLLRHYKPVPGRLRPEDTMVGHTGYLIFARKVALRPGIISGWEPDADETSGAPIAEEGPE